ncbi:adenylate/guanylate cyclase domain-containing protein [Inhella gelatinilytica]|uniref:FHA domain-containing protein n=1 Tax=Inhella gelatinilytica TaxID=2795030 RepID=A0A931IVB7_9BURK|nr:adenylate/guanylate cyclase domain-containing protein [Inhella gelatinilytica]MBH9553465.1 FHA domain-containing protein [Inhella gelatinilytica]
MTQTRQSAVVFADLRGSTALFESLGNAEATTLVTAVIDRLQNAIEGAKGRVVKTLGDGLMAVCEKPCDALNSAQAMHDALLHLGPLRPAHAPNRLKLQVAMSYGEIVELQGDCFGDAVNVAARLLDHAGDHETLVTEEFVAALAVDDRSRFRSLEHINLRGRAEPVHVHVLRGVQQALDAPPTEFGDAPFQPQRPEGIRLTWLGSERFFDTSQLPIVLGRSADAAFCVTDTRVSRSHARIDWHAGSYVLTDLSFNGSFVRFSGSQEVVPLRRSACTLHGSGSIGLGASPTDLATPVVRFDVLHFADTQPHARP